MRRMFVLAVLVALTLAACSDDGEGDGGGATTAAPAPEGATSSVPTTSGGDQGGPPAEQPAGTRIEEHPELGQIYTTPDGMTLYAFLLDNAGGEATCTGGCAEAWPPYPDAESQVVVGGWPLYTYGGDAAPGDTNGQGVGTQWYVMTTDGPAEP